MIPGCTAGLLHLPRLLPCASSDGTILRREMPVHIPIETMAENIKQLALANLENLKRNKR